MTVSDTSDLEKKVNALFAYFQTTAQLLDNVVKQNNELLLKIAEAERSVALTEQSRAEAFVDMNARLARLEKANAPRTGDQGYT